MQLFIRPSGLKNNCMNTFLTLKGPKIPLGEACIATIDVCDDSNALCLNGRCECKNEYHEENKMCS